ncbi:MAG: A/G-specific adenine glycosylase [Bacteroidales bacterium]
MGLTDTLLTWYDQSARVLPWRQTKDPYRIWVSEVILQQTRVNQGLPYYERFVAQFPGVAVLAAASEEEVLRLWQGLGYYSRARNLHAGARQIMLEWGGQIPLKYQELIKVKGIGSYTAAAVASIAGNEPVPVLDGNTLRVYARLFAIEEPVDKAQGRRSCMEAGQQLISHSQPGRFNQAVMELGALICTPGKPKCGVCPIRDFCMAYVRGIQNELPRKESQVKVKDMEINYLVLLVVDEKGFSLIMKRRNKGIWRHLYDFPELETIQETFNHSLEYLDWVWNPLGEIHATHTLTHRLIQAKFYVFGGKVSSALELPDGWILTRLNESFLPELPISRLIHQFLTGKSFQTLALQAI